MKLTLKQIVECTQALSRLASEKYSGKVAYAIAKNVRTITSEMEVFEKVRAPILEKYGEKNNDQYVIKGENMQAFTDEMDAILAEEVEVDIRPVVLPENTQISAGDIVVLDWMIKIEGLE